METMEYGSTLVLVPHTSIVLLSPCRGKVMTKSELNLMQPFTNNIFFVHVTIVESIQLRYSVGCLRAEVQLAWPAVQMRVGRKSVHGWFAAFWEGKR